MIKVEAQATLNTYKAYTKSSIFSRYIVANDTIPLKITVDFVKSNKTQIAAWPIVKISIIICADRLFCKDAEYLCNPRYKPSTAFQDFVKVVMDSYGFEALIKRESMIGKTV